MTKNIGYETISVSVELNPKVMQYYSSVNNKSTLKNTFYWSKHALFCNPNFNTYTPSRTVYLRFTTMVHNRVEIQNVPK